MLVVQKYGGATVADPEKIKKVAARLAALHQQGHQVVAVVSAMGKTTNQLIELAHQISSTPNRRELDMLLTTGERVTMALVSMALHDLGVPAISFTGSQAGILTDQSHFNAQIVDVRPSRVQEALASGKVVVLAGFQGVNPHSKEITTLGRGGSDSTAIAMAAALNADRCEILKDVPAVFSGDPQKIQDAKAIARLTYDQLLDMTRGGAKVLYHRGVEIAKQNKVPLYIGPAFDHAHIQPGAEPSPSFIQGTWIMPDDFDSAESTACHVLSVNSHARVLLIRSKAADEGTMRSTLFSTFNQLEIPEPQILNSTLNGDELCLFITGPLEVLDLIERAFDPDSVSLTDQAIKATQLLRSNFVLDTLPFCAIRVTASRGVCLSEIAQKCSEALKHAQLSTTLAESQGSSGGLGLTFLFPENEHLSALRTLHTLI